MNEVINMKLVTTLEVKLDKNEYQTLKDAVKVLIKIGNRVGDISTKLECNPLVSDDEQQMAIIDYLQEVRQDFYDRSSELESFINDYTD